MEKVFCISAGQLIIKKEDNIINRRNRYLNYGLLSLATELKESGFNPVQIQGDFDNPEIALSICVKYGFDESEQPILISIPSFYAISWVNEFIRISLERKANAKFIIGGRWVVADDPNSIKKLIPNADLIIPGIANSSIVKIIKSITESDISTAKQNSAGNYPNLDYQLLHNRNLYQPSIEVSRGCGKGCSFCQERNERLQPLKKPSLIIEEATNILLSDDMRKMTPYFEASMFAPNSKWINELTQLRTSNNLDFEWRAEGRIDSISPSKISNLRASGLKVIDLGLESASPIQLLRMKKTKNPDKYLSKASELLKAAYDNDIMLKINILLTAGETLESIEETISWLEQHRTFIKGVSVGPVIAFGLPHQSKEYIEEINNFGATLSHSPTDGITHINLSKEIDYEKSIKISKDISKEFMDADDYYQLKSFSYFSRDYNYQNFIDDILSSDKTYSFDDQKVREQNISERNGR